MQEIEIPWLTSEVKNDARLLTDYTLFCYGLRLVCFFGDTMPLAYTGVNANGC